MLKVILIDKDGNQTTKPNQMVRRKIVTMNEEPENKAEQSHKDLTNINNIIAKYDKTGIIEHRKEFSGYYDDFTGQDFTDMQFQVAKANSMFEELPATVRNKFKNSPAEFLDFVQNPKNAEEMVSLGLSKARYDETSNQTINQHYTAKGDPLKEHSPESTPVDAPEVP